MTPDDTRSFTDERERREKIRYPVRVNVNYRHGDTYLFSSTSNVSELGIFLVSEDPKPKDTILSLEFNVPNLRRPVQVAGRVAWVEDGRSGAEPGMGIQFVDLTDEARRQIKSLIRTTAFIDD
jgi:uncharacterized protein (TIGR02266 family)